MLMISGVLCGVWCGDHLLTLEVQLPSSSFQKGLAKDTKSRRWTFGMPKVRTI